MRFDPVTCPQGRPTLRSSTMTPTVLCGRTDHESMASSCSGLRWNLVLWTGSWPTDWALDRSVYTHQQIHPPLKVVPVTPPLGLITEPLIPNVPVKFTFLVEEVNVLFFRARQLPRSSAESDLIELDPILSPHKPKKPFIYLFLYLFFIGVTGRSLSLVGTGDPNRRNHPEGGAVDL